MLDEFGAVDVGDEKGGHERFVDLLHQGRGALAVRAEDDAVRLHEIGHGRTFAEELGVRDDVELGIRGVALDRLGDLFPGFHRNGRLVDHDLVALDARGDFPGHLLDELQVHRPVWIRWGRHRDEDDLAVINPLLGARGEGKPTGGDVLCDEIGEPGFIDRDFPRSTSRSFSRRCRRTSPHARLRRSRHPWSVRRSRNR